MDNFRDTRATNAPDSGQEGSASIGYGNIIPTTVTGIPQVAYKMPAEAPVAASAPAPQAPATLSAQPTFESLRPTDPVSSTPPQPPPHHYNWENILKITGFATLGLIILVGLLYTGYRVVNRSSTDTATASRFTTVEIPLAQLIGDGSVALIGTRTLVVNGSLQANSSVTISPSGQPSNANRGQIYYDKNSNQLAYFNGSRFVPVTDSSQAVQSLGGQSGQIIIGEGLTAANGTISNSGVLSMQGQTGNVTLTAGPGITVDGTTLINSGVTSFGGQTGDIAVGTGLTLTNGTLSNNGLKTAASGSPNITVANDGNGNITISSTGGGTGTVQSSGGSVGRIAKFTGVQTIEDSLLSEGGSTVTVNGSLSVTGNLALATALTVGNGGTGTTALANNGVVIGQGAGALTAVTAAGPGLCFTSTAGAPQFAACPGAAGVSSVNGQTGAITIANATAAAGTVTINDASTSQKGIAQFNSTNFSAASGVINTVQNINTTADPTFRNLSLSTLSVASSQASAPMALINNTNTGATGNLLDLQLNGASRLSVSPAGAMTLSGTLNGQTISSAANFTGTLAVAGAATLNGGASVTGTLAANTITPTSTMTIGAGTQQLTLQGNSSTSLSAANGANATTLAFQSPTANVTYRLLTATAGTYDICTTAGNCTGIGGGVSTSGGTTNRLSKFTGSQTIGDSIISDNGSTVTVGGVLAVNTITPSSSLVVGAVGQNVTLQGAATQVTATNSGITNTLTFATPSGSNKTITVPNASGTVAVSASGPLAIDANGNLTCPTCVTSGGGGGGVGAVDSLNGLTGALTLANASGSGATITINDASTSQKGIAQFNSTNFTASSGTVNTIQDIATTAAPSFARLNLISSQATNQMLFVNNTNASASGNLLDLQLNSVSRLSVSPAGNMTLSGTINGQTISSSASLTGSLAVAGAANLNGGASVTGTLSATTITPTGSMTIGATNQSVTLQGSAGSTITATDSGTTTTLAFQTPTANVTYRLPTAAAGSYDICTTAGNCSGAGVTLQSAYNNSSSPEITLDATRGALTIRDNATPLGANLFEIQNNAGSTTYLSVTATGTTVTGGLTQSGGNFSSTSTGAASLTAGGAITITAGSSSTWSTSSGDLAVQAAGNLALSSGGTIELQDSTNITGDLDVSGSLNVGTANAFQVAAGGGITSAGSAALQGGTITLGTTSVAGSVILNDGSTNTGTIQVAALGQNTVYTLPDPGGSSATICLSTGNCAGVGGSITGSGTNGTLAKFTGTGSIGDSLLSESAGTVTANGNFNLTTGNQYRINGSQISSANLSNDADLAKLNASQTFTGDNSFNANVTLGDSAADSLTIGAVLQGATPLTFEGGTADANELSLAIGTLTADRTITLPDENGTICLQSSTNCGFAANTGGSGYIQNQTAVAQLANFYIQSAAAAATPTAALKLASGQTGNLLEFQDASGNIASRVDSTGFMHIDRAAATSDVVFTVKSTADTQSRLTISADGKIGWGSGSAATDNFITRTAAGALEASNQFTVMGGLQVGAAGFLGKLTIQGGSTSTVSQVIRAVASQTADQIQLQDSAGNINAAFNPAGNQLTLGRIAASGTVTQGKLLLADGTTSNFGLTLQTATLTANHTVTLPNEAGIVCLQGSTACGFAPASGSANYIQNSTFQQTANMNIISAAAGSIGARIEGAAGMSAQALLVKAGSSPTANAFEVQNSGSTQLFAVDASNSRITVGSGAGCSGRLCVTQSITGTSTSTNLYNIQNVNSSGAGTTIGHNVIINDTSTAQANTLRPFVIDTTGTTNASASINAIQVRLPASASGTAIQIQNGSNDIFNVNNNGSLAVRDASNTSFLDINTTSGTINLGITGSTATAGTTNISTTTGAAQTVTVGSSNTGSTTTVHGGGGLTFLTNSSGAGITTRSSVNSATAFQSQNAANTPIFNLDTTDSNLIANISSPDFEVNSGGWTAQGTSTTVTRDTTYAYHGAASLRIVTGTVANSGARLVLNPIQTSASTNYTVSFFARKAVGDAVDFSDLIVRYSPNGSATVDCNVNAMNSQVVLSTGWTRFWCTFSSATTPTTSGYLQIKDTAGAAHTFWVDGIQLEQSSGEPSVYGSGALSLNAVINSPLAFRNVSNSQTAVTITDTSNNNLFNVDTVNNEVNLGLLQPGTNAPTKLTFGDRGGLQLYIGEATTDAHGDANADSDVLELHGGAGLVMSTGYTGDYKQRVALDEDGSFKIADDLTNQTKGYRMRTSGSGLDFEATGAGVTGELWISGWTGSDYTGTQVNFLRMAASQRLIMVGTGSGTSTPTLLALDYKNDNSSDPTAYTGSMYYNAVSNKFRCYENSIWRDCIAGARTQYQHINEMIGTTAGEDSGFFSGNSGTFSGSAIAGSPGHPGIAQLSTGGTTNGYAAAGSNDTGQSYRLGNGDYWRFETLLQIPTLSDGTNTFTFRTGLTDGSNTDGVDGCLFKYSHSVNSGRWQGVCTNNSSQSTCDTTISVAAGTWYRLTVVVNSAGTSTDFQINGTSRCQVTNNIPTGAGREVSWNTAITKSAGTSARTAQLDYVEIHGQFGTAR